MAGRQGRRGTRATGAVRVFISHAHDDRRLAAELLALLQAALPLADREIRCTSGDGSGLPGGAQIDEHLRRDVRDAEVLIGVVSGRSVQSSYVLFEMGARWGANTYMVPVLAPGERATILPGPLPGRIALRLDNDRQVNQCVREIAERLGLTADTGPKYVSHRTRLAHIRPSRARDTSARLAAAIKKLKSENAALIEQTKLLEDASWRPHPTLDTLSLSASFDEKGSGVQIRRWSGIHASETIVNKRIPYAFAVAKPKGKASAPAVSEITNPRSELDVLFKPRKGRNGDPSRVEGDIELVGALTASTGFVGFEVQQEFERAFYMTRSEMVNAYARDKWRTEYISIDVVAPTEVLELSVEFPAAFAGVSPKPVAFVGYDETLQEEETQRMGSTFAFNNLTASVKVSRPLRGLQYAIYWMPPK